MSVFGKCIETECVIKPREDDGTMTCPSCRGMGSDMRHGGMDSMSITKQGEAIVYRSKRYPCPMCDGNGRVKKCTCCGGSGVCK